MLASSSLVIIGWVLPEDSDDRHSMLCVARFWRLSMYGTTREQCSMSRVLLFADLRHYCIEFQPWRVPRHRRRAMGTIILTAARWGKCTSSRALIPKSRARGGPVLAAARWGKCTSSRALIPRPRAASMPQEHATFTLEHRFHLPSAPALHSAMLQGQHGTGRWGTLAIEIAKTRENLVEAEPLLKDDQQYLKDLIERCECRH